MRETWVKEWGRLCSDCAPLIQVLDVDPPKASVLRGRASK